MKPNKEVAEAVKTKAKANATPNYIRRPLTTTPATRSLSLAEQRARARWQRPIAAIIANALVENRGLLDRLNRNVRGPDWDHKELYQATLNELWETTQKQIRALEIFSRVEWSD
jgi:hypothetical protein